MHRTLRAALAAVPLLPLIVAAVPGAAGSAAAASGGGVGIPSGPAVRLAPGAATVTSSNWSGYALQGAKTGKFLGIEAAWQVPTVNTKAAGDQYAADWIGIDGAFNNKELIQAGTQEENLNGEPVYYAWYELLPANEVLVKKIVVHPGDFISAEIELAGTDTWQIALADQATGAGWSTTVKYATPEQDAEAVHERPTINGSLPALAQTSNALFLDVNVEFLYQGEPAWAPITYDFSNTTSRPTLDRIFLTNKKDTQTLASPSSADQYGCFQVADGSKIPGPVHCAD